MADRRGASPDSALVITRRDVLAAASVGLAIPPAFPAWAAAGGQLTWGIHVSLARVSFEPAGACANSTPFTVFYALHDAYVKSMPGKALAPSLAESWPAAEDGPSYAFPV